MSKTREKLVYVCGMLEGLSWLVADNGASDAISNAKQQIEIVLQEMAEEA